MSVNNGFHENDLDGLEKPGAPRVEVKSGLSKYHELRSAVVAHCTHCAAAGETGCGAARAGKYARPVGHPAPFLNPGVAITWETGTLS